MAWHWLSVEMRKGENARLWKQRKGGMELAIGSCLTILPSLLKSSSLGSLGRRSSSPLSMSLWISFNLRELLRATLQCRTSATATACCPNPVAEVISLVTPDWPRTLNWACFWRKSFNSWQAANLGRCRPARPKGRLYRHRKWMLPQYASLSLNPPAVHLETNPSHLNFYSLGSEASNTPGPQVPNLLICRLRPLLQGGYPWPLGSRWSERAEALLGQQQDVASGGSRCWDRQTLTSCKLPGFQVAAFLGNNGTMEQYFDKKMMLSSGGQTFTKTFTMKTSAWPPCQISRVNKRLFRRTFKMLLSDSWSWSWWSHGIAAALPSFGPHQRISLPTTCSPGGLGTRCPPSPHWRPPDKRWLLHVAANLGCGPAPAVWKHGNGINGINQDQPRSTKAPW